MHVRSATLGDLDTICDFNVRLASETEHKSLDRECVRRGVAALLDDPAKGRYLVAESDGRVVGQLAITFEWSDWRDGWFWWIQSVYVESSSRGRGVFKQLFRQVNEEAVRAGDVVGIRLYVEAENQAAHATYERLGLDWTTYRVMERMLNCE